MITKLKVGDKVKIGELVLTCDRDYPDGDGEFLFWNTNTKEARYFTLDDLNAMGAVLVKEPMKMTVWEWRKFPKVQFKSPILDLPVYWYGEEGDNFPLFNIRGEYEELSVMLLESIGTEVL